MALSPAGSLRTCPGVARPVEQGSRRPRRATRIRHRGHLCTRAYARLPGLARARRGARERERSKYTRPQEPWGRHCYTILLHGGELTVWHGDGRSKRERVPGPTPPTALQLRTVRARLGARTAGRSNVYVTSTSLSPRFYRAWLRDAVWGKKPLPAP